jgi:hypothetical protein
MVHNEWLHGSGVAAQQFRKRLTYAPSHRIDRATHSARDDANIIGHYSISKSMRCRFIRIRQTLNHHRNKKSVFLDVGGFEIHGILHEA